MTDTPSFPLDSPVRGTRVHRPDLDWSQVRESLLMLEVIAGQIMAAMRDSDNSVDVLANTFTSMAGYVHSIAEIANQLPNNPEITGQKAALTSVSEHVSTMVNQAVVAFQFYDKLVQRLSHVVHGLSEFSGIIGDQRKLYNPFEWAELHDRIRAKLSTQEERVLLESVLSGTPLQEALETYLHQLQSKGDEIEFF